MNTGIVMIILMLLPGGEPSASFVNIDTAEECEQRLDRIRPILEGGKAVLQEVGCFRSTVQFDDFDHDPPTDTPRHTFFVGLHGDQATIRKLKTLDECRSTQNRVNGKSQDKSYCTTSTQDFVAAEN